MGRVAGFLLKMLPAMAAAVPLVAVAPKNKRVSPCFWGRIMV